MKERNSEQTLSWLDTSLFLEPYLSYASHLTDAPRAYHEAVGLLLLSVSVGRRLWMPLRQKHLYPNIWVILLGNTTTHRKSTAIEIGVSLLSAKKVSFAPQDSSPEALIEYLSNHPVCIYIRDEFGGFLADMEKKYMTGTKEFLCKIFDCSKQPYWRSLRSVTFTIRKPCLSLLAATTRTRFIEYINRDDLLSGFVPRFLISVGDKTEWKPVSHETSKDKTSKERLKTILAKIAGTKYCEVRIADSALDFYNTWLRGWEAQSIGEVYLDEMGGFYGRSADYALKFAALYWVDDPERKEKIEIRHIKKGIQTAEKHLDYARCIVEEIMKCESKGIDIVNKVAQLIKRYNRLDHSTLLRNSNLTANDLRSALETLVQRSDVETKYEGGKKIYIWKGV